MFWIFAGIVACAGLSVSDSSAQGYPVKPIRIVVGFPAGGTADVVARMVAQKLPEHLGQPAIVENRPGAGSSIATERVATSPADGYTLLMLGNSGAVQPVLRAKLPYDLERDLAPVSSVVIGPFVLVVHPSVPARNVGELIALARSRPGKLNYGTNGVATSPHLAAELFNWMAKAKIVHVPYKGASEYIVAVAAGEIDMSFSALSPTLPLLKVGKLRALAVTSAKRASLMPSIPTLGESGMRGYDRSTWFGVLTPAGVAKVIIAQLNAVLGKVVNTPEMKEAFSQQGLEPQTGTPEQFAAFIRGEIAQNARLIKMAGVKPE
ncbi:MAG: tripartite tricarboxylate transporter substrate binding protein [Betaproteobacteria bacterium]|nr:tripartite tricarboxylate transporter substrate binding protein [Betaproteobacteria bacterium]